MKSSAFHVRSVLANRGKYSHAKAKRKMALATADSCNNKSTDEGLDRETNVIFCAGSAAPLTPYDCALKIAQLRIHVLKRIKAPYCPDDKTGHVVCSAPSFPASASGVEAFRGTRRHVAGLVKALGNSLYDRTKPVAHTSSKTAHLCGRGLNISISCPCATGCPDPEDNLNTALKNKKRSCSQTRSLRLTKRTRGCAG